MKTVKIFLFAAAAMLLTACSGGVTPASEKVQGPLSEYFETVIKDYKPGKNGTISIEFKRIKDGFPEPWEKGMKYDYGFSLEFQDGDGNSVGKEETGYNNASELMTLANLNVGESASVTFDCPKGAEKFKVNSTFELCSFTKNLSGKIGPYAIQMTLKVDADGDVTGAYYYKKKGPGALLYVKGTKDGDEISLTEFAKGGEQTGSFQGNYSNGSFRGDFTAKSGEYVFSLTEDRAMDAIDLSVVNFSAFSPNEGYESFDDVDSYESAGSEDWDALLRSYEQYVDKYISYMKKAANGDMSALAEYPALMEKAQEFSDKMKDAEGYMSASQWARYNKITMKMLEAANEMR